MPLETFIFCFVVKQFFCVWWFRSRENNLSLEIDWINVQNALASSQTAFFTNSSLSVVNDSGYKLFTIQNVNKVDEIYASDHVDTRIAERLFSSSLVATVWSSEQNKLKVSTKPFY